MLSDMASGLPLSTAKGVYQMSAMSITLWPLLGECFLASLVVSALLVAGCDMRHMRNTGVHITPGLVGQ